MKTADYAVWLAVLPDQRDAARADAGTHPDGRSAIAWNKEQQLWYARPGADLDRLQKWLPDRSIRSSGGGDPQSEFFDALTSAGLVLDGLPVMDGQRHRVPVVDGKKGNRDGVYRGFLDGVKPGGWYINYHRADNDKDITRWKASGSTGEADPLARVHIRAVMRQSQDDFAREQAALYAQQTAKAQSLYDRLPAADPAHSYLERKGITVADDVRQTRNGALVVPFHDADGAFRTLQYIPPDGEKYLFKDAPKAGHFRVEGGELRNGEPILYAEGYATARSLYMVTGRPVVMTIDAGNMEAVANVLKVRYPDSPHLFMADVDHAKEKNKGVLSANRAAAATGGVVLLPDLTAAEIERGFTDFNDLHLFRGAERLRETLLPDIAQALEQLNYKDAPMATPDDAQPAPDNHPAVSPDAPEVMPARRPGAAKEKTDEILKLRDQGLKPAQIAEQLGIGQTSVYRILKAQQTDAPATDSTIPASNESEPVTPAETSAAAEAPGVNVSDSDIPAPATGMASTAEAQPVTATVAAPSALAPTVTQAEALTSPASPVMPPPSAAAYDGFTGLYGTGAELRDRLAALASGQISPATLLQDISTLRSRVESALIAGVYTREHVKEMQQVFDRVTQGGMAGANVMETGGLSRLRGLLGQRDTWSSLHPTGGTLDVNTVPDRVAQQYALLARGDVTRAQFDREVRMLYSEFTRADPERFKPGRQEETRAVFERMASLESPERAAQYSATAAVIAAQLPPASAADPNATALVRIQMALRDEFVSLARGETAAPALTENVARLQAQLDDAKAQGVYASSHLEEVQGAFDRVTQDGLAGMPSPDASVPRGDYLTRNPGAASLDVATVPARIEAQLSLLVRGDVSRAQFEDNLVVLRNEVVRLSEIGKVTPAALSAAEGAFANLGALPAPSDAASPAPLSVTVTSSDALSPEPKAVPAPSAVVTPSMAIGTEPVTSVTKANVTDPQPNAAIAATASEMPVVSAIASEQATQAPSVSAPVASAVSDVSSQTAEADARPERAARTPELAHEEMAQAAAEDAPQPDASPGNPLTSSFGAENAILVGAPRVAAQDEDAPASSGSKSARIDADKLLSRVTHEKHPDGKSVLYKLDGEPAFIDHGNRLVMAEGTSSHEEKVLAALLTAAHQYHGRIELTGSDEFKAFAIDVIVANKLDVSMKNASQQAELDAARRAAGQPVSPAAPADAVRGDQQVPRTYEAPPITQHGPAAHADEPVKNSAPMTGSQQQNSVPASEPAAPKISPAVHTPAEKAREPVTGKVTAFGQAPFRFEPDASESTFITLRTKEGPQTFWGKELAGLLRETNLKTGRMVTLQWQGKQPVTVKVPRKNEEGVVTHYENENTHRNRWSLSPAGGSRVQTGADDLVPLAAVDVNRYTQIQHTLVSRLDINIDAPPKPADGLYWFRPDGQGSSQPGDPLSAPRPAHNDRAGVPVMSSWGEDGRPDLLLVQGDGDYLQGVVRQNGTYQHVLVSLPGSTEAPPMVVNLLTPEGAQPIGSGNGINRSNGQPVPREHVVVRFTGDTQQRIAKLDSPADVPAALHARLGYDERYKAESGWVKEQPAAAPQAVPATPPRPAQ
ncbi:LPD7 domain-containing protein [Pantoea agglomerans]|uniref:LPD7 domain-containing protein n=1 Tax=Enterobacter agglomerans TaxID=549 RepID=UPI003209DFF7